MKLNKPLIMVIVAIMVIGSIVIYLSFQEQRDKERTTSDAQKIKQYVQLQKEEVKGISPSYKEN